MGRAPSEIASRLVWPLALLVAACGALSLIGWSLGLPALTTIVRGRPHMPPNTALALLVLAAGIAASAKKGGGARAFVRIVAGASVAFLGVVTLAEYVFGLDLTVDRVGPWATSQQPFPGRPSPPTALGFVCLGAALIVLDRDGRPGRRAAEWLAGISGLVALLALTGHAAGSGALYRLPGSTVRGVAVHAAVGLGAAAVAILCARPTVGLMALVTSRGPGGSLARRLAIPAMWMPPALSLLVSLLVRAGWRDLPLAFALMAVGIVPLMLALVLGIAWSIERAHERLRRAEASFRALVELAPDAIFIADSDGVYTDVNDCGARLLGRQRDEIVGMRILDLIPPESAPQLAAERRRLADPSQSVVGDWSLLHKDGHYLPVEVSARILPDGRWLGFVRDIRARKESERRLAEAHAIERRARAQIEAVANATLEVSEAVAAMPESDLQSVLQTIVRQAQTLTNATYGALGVGSDPTLPFEIWVYVGMSEEIARRMGRPPRPVGALGEVARRGRTIRVPDVTALEEFVGLPEGHPSIGSFLGVPICFRGRPVGNLYLANKQGVPEFTEDDERMAALLASRAGTAIETVRLYHAEAIARGWLQSVIDEMPEAVITTDRLGHIKLMNAAARAYAIDRDTPDPFGNLLGFEVRSPTGEPIAPDRQPLARALFGELMREELLLRNRAGDWIWVLASGAQVRGGVGGEGGTVLVLQDVTAMRELQRLRDEWTSIVAHDLRQPIQLVNLSAEMLTHDDEGFTPAQKKTVERIRGAAGRIEQMIRDLLDVSRIEARQLSLKPERIEVVDWVKEAVARAAPVLGDHPVRIEVKGAIGQVRADPGRLEQILGNLLSNAAKYSEPKSEIVVALVARGDQVEIAVTNRGEGVPADEQPLLFTRFFRTRRARAGSREGLGMGLYITRGLVEAHGGRIGVSSRPDRTTTFSFTLPCEGRVGTVDEAPAPR